MVAKLLKHELYALFRILIFLAAAVFVFAVASRVLVYFAFVRAYISDTLTLFTIFVIFFYIIAISALSIAAYVMGINRFYKTLFTGEGYMTLSLPATPVQLIWAKLLSALIGTVFASVVSLLSLLVFLVGWDSGVMQQILLEFSIFGELISLVVRTEPLLLVEFIVLFIVSLPLGLLIMFSIICIGQMFNERRKVAIFALTAGVYFILNSIVSLCLVPVMTLAAYVSPHLMIWIYILVCAALDAGCFFFVRYVLKNKVNLIA